MSLTGSVDPAAHPRRLACLDHPAVAALARASGETGVGVCFGIAERSPAGDPYITQIFAANGSVAGVQRKRHLGEAESRLSPLPSRTSSSARVSGSGSPSAPRPDSTRRSTRPLRAVPNSFFSRRRRVFMAAVPTKRPGEQASPGGRDALWATHAATRSAWSCGSRWRDKPVQPWMTTFPAWPRWSGPTAASPPAYPTGGRGCSPSTSLSDRTQAEPRPHQAHAHAAKRAVVPR